MMNFKLILFTSVTTCLVFANINVANADNGLLFPPADNSQIYQYPPTNPVRTQNNKMVPTAPTNAFTNSYPGMQNFQQPMMMPPVNTTAPYGLQNSNMQNRNYPAYNSNQSFPFNNNMPYGNNFRNNSNPFSGGNMPFGNNSGNNFNPFSGGNMPFGNNSGNNFNPFSGGNMPFGNNSGNNFNPFSGGNMPFGNNNNNSSLPFFKQSKNNRKKAWGDERNIWPDFYTDFTDDAWDSMSSGPRDLGVMPGGWRFPHISTPDPVTVSDAITNQFPPMAEEGGNMIDPSDWGMFDDK